MPCSEGNSSEKLFFSFFSLLTLVERSTHLSSSVGPFYIIKKPKHVRHSMRTNALQDKATMKVKKEVSFGGKFFFLFVDNDNYCYEGEKV
jgi:hypothetical protein